MLSDETLHQLLALPMVIVLDEAYIEFSGRERSRMSWVPDNANLIVLRTFSKWAGLAGLRVGYGAFPPLLLPYLWKIKQPYNVSVAASTAAIAALADTSTINDNVARIVSERHRLLELLQSIPYLRPYPSEANFVLCQVQQRDAHTLKMSLESQGILVRYFNKPGLEDHIRISVGRPEQTDRLITALRRL
jgi:histidinol-phosphate aminotransferase